MDCGIHHVSLTTRMLAFVEIDVHGPVLYGLQVEGYAKSRRARRPIVAVKDNKSSSSGHCRLPSNQQQPRIRARVRVRAFFRAALPVGIEYTTVSAVLPSKSLDAFLRTAVCSSNRNAAMWSFVPGSQGHMPEYLPMLDMSRCRASSPSVSEIMSSIREMMRVLLSTIWSLNCDNELVIASQRSVGSSSPNASLISPGVSIFFFPHTIQSYWK
ncbi:hypothetical protein KCV03_g97, partial [Aureobasidium melanogenum]